MKTQKTRKGVKNFSYEKRLKLEALLKAKVPVNEIADILKFSRVTIWREIQKGLCDSLDGQTWIFSKRYSPVVAQENYLSACSARGRPIKLGNDFEFVNYFKKRVLEDKVSAGAVYGQIKHLGLKFKTEIGKTTLYRYIKLGYMGFSLPARKNKHKVKVKKQGKRPPRGISIEERPKEVSLRNTFGHWEMDLVCGPNNASLLVLTERLTRFEIIFKMEDKRAVSIVRCLNKLEHKFGKRFKEIFKTITVDNGPEFADYLNMEKSIYSQKLKRTLFYYCHPYRSNERGTNERMNREIRRLIPKKTNIRKLSAQFVQSVEDWLNNYPRQVLKFATSKELFQEQLALIA